MSGALDSAWLTLLEARRYNATKNGLMVEDKWTGDGRSANEDSLSNKLTAIARSSELKLRCLQNELAAAGGGSGATDGGLYAYGPPVWDSYQSLTKVPKIFRTLQRHDADEDWSSNACFNGPHRSSADLRLNLTTSVAECNTIGDSPTNEEKKDVSNCTFCSFCNSPEEHWQHFRHKHRSIINSVEVSMAAQRAASARSVYNRWSRYNSAVRRKASKAISGSEYANKVDLAHSTQRHTRHTDNDSILAEDTALVHANNSGGNYKVLVRTGKVGTSLKARLKLVGSEGTSTFCDLRRGPTSKPFSFFSETTEIFFLPIKCLGEIQACYLQIEGRPGQQWFLEELIVIDLKNQKAWCFNVHLNLAMTEGHRIVTFEIRPVEQRTTRGYEVTVVTGKVNFAGTDATVSITLSGRKGVSEKIPLRQTVNGKKPFKLGQTDVFHINTSEIGDLTRIRIEHDNRGTAAGWYLDHITVRELDGANGQNKAWSFPCNQWIAEDEGDHKLYKDLHALPQSGQLSHRESSPRAANVMEGKKRLPKTTPSLCVYELTIETGASSFAGQNVNVFVQLFGSAGRSNEIWFPVGNTGRFERGTRDKLCLETANVGTVREVRIGHDHTGYGSGWLLDKIILRKFFTTEEIHEFRRLIRRRIALADKPSYEYNDADATLFEDEDDVKGFRDPEEYEEFKQSRLEVAKDRVPAFEEYRFVCGQWLAVDDDGSGSKTETTMRPTSSAILFRDMSENALAEEKQRQQLEAHGGPIKKPPSAGKTRTSSKPPKDKATRLEESKIKRRDSVVKVVPEMCIKIELGNTKLQRPRSSSQPRLAGESEGIVIAGHARVEGSSGRPKSSLAKRNADGMESELAPRHARPHAASISRGHSREHHGGKAVLYSDEESSGEDAEIEEHYGMSSSTNSRDGRLLSPSTHSTHSYIHIKSRTPVYAIYQGKEIRRFHVPDEKVPWNVEFKEYAPIDWTSPDMMGSWVDPDIRKDRNYRLKFNANDGKVNRQSHTGEYKLTDNREGHGGVPINPMGRTGLRGRGKLGRWGPNHAGDPIVTRWKRSESNIVVMHPKTGKPILQFVAIRRRDTGEWAIPGGMVDAGEQVGTTLKREFMEEALASLGDLDERAKINIKKLVDQFFQAGNAREIYRGYVDDPRNTDNAWMETVAVNFHDESGTSVGKLPLRAGDDAAAVRWADISGDVRLYASHSSFLQRIVRILNAHW